MMWLALLGGLVVGGVLWGWTGAVILGFVAWLAALIFKSRAAGPPAVRVPVASAPQVSQETRIARLENALEELRRRVAQLEGTPIAEATPELVAPTQTPDLAVPAQSPELPPPVPPIEAESPSSAQRLGAEAPTPSVQGPTPRPPAAPPRGLLDRLLEGNVVAKLGVVILFFGVAFLLKFAYDRGLFPPGMRLAAVAAASVVLFVIGLRLLATRRTYALVLMGGAMGLLYLDVFFALKTFQFIGPAAGFALFAALGVATLLLAVRLDARAFATLGLLGGFLAPVLASTGAGQHVILFSYYLLLNLVILATSWFRSWRELNFVGFLFTFAIALLWGHDSYRPELFSTVEPFLVAFFALYLAIPILFASRQPPQLRGVVDGTLVFGVPLTAAMMQAGLVRGMGDGPLAWSAAIAAVVYGALAAFLWKRDNMRLLAEAHLALAIVFGTIAPYFALEGYPTFAFWTLEGAAVYWVGCRQRSLAARGFGLALQAIAAAYFCWVTRDAQPTHAVWNQRVVGCTLVALAGLATAWFVHHFSETLSRLERALEGWIVGWGMAWLLLGAWLAMRDAWHGPLERLAALLAFCAAIVAAAEWAGGALRWPWLRRSEAMLTAVVLLAAWVLSGARGLTFDAPQWLAWIAAYAAIYFALRRQERDGVALRADVQHVSLFAAFLLVLARDAHSHAEEASLALAWRYAAVGIVLALGLGAATEGLRRRLWPFAAHASAFRAAVVAPLLWLSLLWTLAANVASDGTAEPWRYIPVLNPLDLTQLALFAAAWAAIRSEAAVPGDRRPWLIALAAAGFLWLNAALLRTVHHWAGVPFELDALLRSVVAQASLSLLWTATALVAMFVAGRRGSRPLWMAGAGLLGVVVVKLFVNDLGDTGTVARIVSFIGVGGLMLLIGFVSPVPPRRQTEG